MTTAHSLPTEVQKILEPLGFSACPERTFSLREVGGELQRLTLENERLLADADRDIQQNRFLKDRLDESQADCRRLVKRALALKAEIAGEPRLKAVRAALRRIVECAADPDCDMDSLRGVLSEELENPMVGEKCADCGGTGRGAGYEDGFDPGSWFGHTQHKVAIDCEYGCVQGRKGQ